MVRVVVGVVMGEVVTRARHYRRLAGASRQELQRVRYLAELAAGGEPLGRLIRIVRNQLVDLLHLRGCEFEYAPFVDSLPRLLHTGVEFPVALERTEQAKARAKTKLELPVWGEGLELGRFVLTLEADCTGIDFDSDARASALRRLNRTRPRLRAPTPSSTPRSNRTGSSGCGRPKPCWTSPMPQAKRSCLAATGWGS